MNDNIFLTEDEMNLLSSEELVAYMELLTIIKQKVDNI